MKKTHFEEITTNTGLNLNVTSREDGAFNKMGDIVNRLSNKKDKIRIKIKTSDYLFLIEEFAMLCVFKQTGQNIYKIGRDFGEQLLKADLNIGCQYIPAFDQEIICIEFPDNIRFATTHGGYIHSCYVTVTEGKEVVDLVKGVRMGKAKKTLAIFSPIYTESGVLRFDVMDIGTLSFWDNEQTVEEAVIVSNKSSTTPYNLDFIRYLMKCLIYINSGDPDLRNQRAPKPPEREGKKLRQWYKAHINESLVDMIYVGYDFKKPIQYLVDKTMVCGHFRWQPWGHNRSKVKLIWIDPHERNFNQAVQQGIQGIQGEQI